MADHERFTSSEAEHIQVNIDTGIEHAGRQWQLRIQPMGKTDTVHAGLGPARVYPSDGRDFWLDWHDITKHPTRARMLTHVGQDAFSSLPRDAQLQRMRDFDAAIGVYDSLMTETGDTISKQMVEELLGSLRLPRLTHVELDADDLHLREIFRDLRIPQQGGFRQGLYLPEWEDLADIAAAHGFEATFLQQF